ncbi:hypothetical protein L345_07064, partial [Ophiophagus hannah]
MPWLTTRPWPIQNWPHNRRASTHTQLHLCERQALACEALFMEWRALVQLTQNHPSSSTRPPSQKVPKVCMRMRTRAYPKCKVHPHMHDRDLKISWLVRRAHVRRGAELGQRCTCPQRGLDTENSFHGEKENWIPSNYWFGWDGMEEVTGTHPWKSDLLPRRGQGLRDICTWNRQNGTNRSHPVHLTSFAAGSEGTSSELLNSACSQVSERAKGPLPSGSFFSSHRITCGNPSKVIYICLQLCDWIKSTFSDVMIASTGCHFYPLATGLGQAWSRATSCHGDVWRWAQFPVIRLYNSSRRAPLQRRCFTPRERKRARSYEVLRGEGEQLASEGIARADGEGVVRQRPPVNGRWWVPRTRGIPRCTKREREIGGNEDGLLIDFEVWGSPSREVVHSKPPQAAAAAAAAAL